ATFTNESASGWQQANFVSPIAITAGTTYIASYYAPAGGYAGSEGFFTGWAVNNGPLHALSDSASGGNGVYHYRTGGGFPNTSFYGTNYWVDVVFTATPDTTAPTVIARTPAANSTGVSTGSTVTATFDESVQPNTISFILKDANNNTVPGSVSYDDTTDT